MANAGLVLKRAFSSSKEEDGLMRTQIGMLSVAGFLGLLAAAEAAPPFDGTYQPYSSTKVTETFVTNKGAMGTCPDRQPGPLTIENGRARYTTETGRNVTGVVKPNGSFDFGFTERNGSSPIHVVGTVDGSGTVRARQMGNRCSYDFAWQK
jgi:hypothetical protein